MALKTIISRFIEKCLKVNLSFWVRLTLKIGRTSMIWDILSQVYQQKSKNLCQYRLIPKYAEAFKRAEIKSISDGKELAIVIQGPVDDEFNFTIETAKIYKKIFPDSYIIISSWKDMPSETANVFKSLGCHVLLSDYPKPEGRSHVNYQIFSTLVGLKKAKELGAKYCIKNRSELRINKPQSFEYLKSLLEVFPIIGNEIPLSGRIITLSGWIGQKFRPFWLQDHLYFGYTDDLIKLFDIPMDTKDNPVSRLFSERILNGEKICKPLPPEVYITVSFVKKYVSIDKLTLRQSWDIIRKYFMVLDFDDLNIIWKKYNIFSLNTIMCESDGKKVYADSYRSLTFSDWVNLYTGQTPYNSEYESIINILP